MSTFVLKLIAIITMAIDHVTLVFVPGNTWAYLVGRSIGRLAFPIFVFLLVEGFHNTRNVKKYLARLGIFALISELPFDLAFYNSYFKGVSIKADLPNMFKDAALFDLMIARFLKHQNIFFTLFLGLFAIWLMSMVEKKYSKNVFYINIINAIITIGFSILAALLRTDYGFVGILLIVAFYLFRGSKPLLVIAMLILSGEITQALSAFSIIPIAFYNGQKGKSMKYFFYAFYPAHILILFLLLLII
jgi:hypothetical protein